MRYTLLLTFFISFSLQAQELVQCGKAVQTIEGKLINSSSSSPILQQYTGSKPDVGTRGELLKYFQTKLFGGNMTGTLVIAEVEIVSFSGSKITLKVLEKKSNIVINGKPKNHFVKGTECKLKIYNYERPKERIEYWETGEIKSKGMAVCGNKIGEWSYYDLKGNLSKVYSLNKDGEIHGEYKEYYPNGNLSTKGEYDDDERKGKWMIYNKDGSEGGYINYRYGKKYGKYELKYANGQTKEIGEYDYSGKIDGVQKGFYEDGKEKFLYDQDSRILKEWYPNGNLKKEHKLNYSGTKKDGRCKEYYENGKLKSDIVYDDDEFEGDYLKYYENGQIKIKGKYKWTDNKKDGEWQEYYENGNLKFVRNYYQGKMTGKAESYHENGNKKIKAYYKNGEPEGEVLSYYENGELKAKANFSNGKKHGEFSKYFEDGSLEGKRNYNMDVMEGDYIDYYAPGKLKEKGSKKDGVKYGPFENYYENGNLKSKGEYTKEGIRDGEWIFNSEDGKLEKKGVFDKGKKIGKWIEVDSNGKKKKIKY